MKICVLESILMAIFRQFILLFLLYLNKCSINIIYLDDAFYCIFIVEKNNFSRKNNGKIRSSAKKSDICLNAPKLYIINKTNLIYP